MRRAAMLFVLFMWAGSLLPAYAQSTFSVTVLHSQLTGSPGNELVCDATVTNMSGGDVVLSFVRRESQLPAGWESSLCVGEACFPSTLDSVAFTPTFGLSPLAAGESRAFSVHVYTTAQSGSGTVRVGLRNNRVSTDTVGMLFSVSTTPAAVLERRPVAASGIELSCYPNPFNPSTTLVWSLDRAAFVTLAIVDILGREVVAPVREPLLPGEYRIMFDPQGHASGVFVARLQVGDAVRARMLVRTK